MTSLEILESACFTCSKSDAAKNQDSILPPMQIQNFLYMAIADGVGGTAGGNIASSAAIDAIRKSIISRPDQKISDLFKVAQQSVAVSAALDKNIQNMATTLVICKVSNQGIEIGSAGDSRAYSLDSRNLNLLTKDHTKKQELIDKGIFTEKELISHHSGNELTSFISSKTEFKLCHITLPVSVGTIILMTDGAYNFVDSQKISKLKSLDLISACSYIRRSIKKPVDDFSLTAMRF